MDDAEGGCFIPMTMCIMLCLRRLKHLEEQHGVAEVGQQKTEEVGLLWHS